MMKGKLDGETQTVVSDFVGFQKIARYSREVIVTEKIDGTNGCIYFGLEASEPMLVGSRTRWITPDQDNHGFARWVYDHESELRELGPGRHFGEWWGSGIQRGYGLQNGEKRFSLFNVIRWCLPDQLPQPINVLKNNNPREVVKFQDVLPPCVGLVPVLWRGNFEHLEVNNILDDLRTNGSRAAHGFMQPEGVVIFHVSGNVGFKKTIEKDSEPKSKGVS
jgi:hypothetical protein